MPVGSPGIDLAEIEAIESKIDFTVIPGISAIESKIDLIGPSIITGISAIESKLDQLDLQHVDEMLSAIESKLDNTIIVDIDDIQEMLSAIESKIEGTTGIMQAISVVDLEVSLIESKLDFAHPDIQTMLSAIESKIDLTLIHDLSAIESKLDANLPAQLTQIDKLAGSETAGNFNYLNAGGEQVMFTITTSTRKKLHSIFMDLATLTQDTTIRVRHKIDGATYRIMETISWTFATDTDGVYFNKSLAINHDLQLTMEEGADEGANRNIPYYYILEDME